MLQAEGRLLGQRGGGEEGHGGKGFEGEVETGRQSRSRIQKSAVYASTLPKRGPTPPSGSSPITNKKLLSPGCVLPPKKVKQRVLIL